MKIRSLFLLLLSGCLRLSAQTLYVHTDKETYLPGEILWFKMYALDSSTYQPLTAKSVGYVDLLDAQGRSVLQGKLPLGEEQRQGGSLFIPQRLTSGSYTLVGSTLGSEAENRNFQKRISILNPFALVDSLPAPRKKQLHYYPEGGTWVKGLPTRLAVQTKDESGHGSAAVLYIKDRQVGQTNAQGHGLLHINAGEHDRIQARFPDGTTVEQELPLLATSGLVLQALAKGKDYQVEIYGTSSFQNATVRLKYGKEYSKTLTLNQQGRANFGISSEELPEGISLLSLQESDGKPIAERLLYRIPERELHIQANLERSVLKTQESVSLHLGSQNLSDWADVSIAVRKIDSLNIENRQNIRSYLYLGQHVRGSIPNEEFYLAKASTEERELLLLIQGWRKITGSAPVKEGRYQHIRVRFTDKTTGQALKDQVAYLSIPDRSAQLYYAVTDEQGIATFSVRTLYENKNIAVRLQSGERANMEILRHVPSGVETEFHLPYAGKIPRKAYTEQGISVQVQNVYTGKERSVYRPTPASDSVAFFGKADARYRLDDYTRFVVMEEVLREYVKEVNVRKNRSDYHLRTLDAARGNFLSEDPLILLDGIPLSSANEIMNYDPLKVNNIDVVAGKYYLGKAVYDGIVSFSTYKGNLENFSLDPAITVFSYEGIQLEREFYVPENDPATPDQRDVLLWIPKISLKGNETQEVKIKTSELPGRYMVDIQGIDKSGKSGAKKVYFEVK